MDFVVFNSWQSDRPNKTNRSLIADALLDAVNSLNADVSISEAVRIDQDTRGVPGSPAITDTILRKIDECDIFLGDVTFIGATTEDRLLPNPNVMIEYGYALKAVGDEHIINVMNTEYGPADQLPFDMQHKRWPVIYSAAPEAVGKELKTAKEKLGKELARRIKEIIEHSTPKKNLKPQFDEMKPQDGVSSYLKPADTLSPRRANFDGRGFQGLNLEKGPRLFLRVIPTALQEYLSHSDLAEIVQNSILFPLGASPYSNRLPGRNSLGAFNYLEKNEEPSIALSVVQLFRNREIWGIDTGLLLPERLMADYGVERPFVPVGALEKTINDCLLNYLKCSYEDLSVSPPIKVVIGIDGVHNYTLSIPDGMQFRRPDGKLTDFAGDLFQDSVVCKGVLSDLKADPEAITNQFVNELWETAGVNRPPDSRQRISE